MQRVPIQNIAVNGRFRRDLGDLTSLTASIRDLGLLHPVVVTSDLRLIAGARRLEACRQLGWTDIPVHIVDLEDLLRAEHDENVVRKDFLPSEAAAIKKALEPTERERARERQVIAGQTCGKGRIAGDKLAPPIKGKVPEKVAAYAGLSHTSLTKAEQIVAAARVNLKSIKTSCRKWIAPAELAECIANSRFWSRQTKSKRNHRLYQQVPSVLLWPTRLGIMRNGNKIRAGAESSLTRAWILSP